MIRKRFVLPYTLSDRVSLRFHSHSVRRECEKTDNGKRKGQLPMLDRRILVILGQSAQLQLVRLANRMASKLPFLKH